MRSTHFHRLPLLAILSFLLLTAQAHAVFRELPGLRTGIQKKLHAMGNTEGTEILVEVKSDTLEKTNSGKVRHFAKFGATFHQSIPSGRKVWHHLSIPEDQTKETFLELLKTDPTILSVSEVATYHILKTPNDPQYGQL